MSTKTLYHPTLNTTVDVPEGDVDSWVESGWRKSKPKAQSEKPADDQ